MNLPSDHYFKVIQTPQDLQRFIATGMAFEMEPHCPSCWSEHVIMKSVWLGKQDMLETT